MLIALSIIAAQAGPANPTGDAIRHDNCVELATGDPARGADAAALWRRSGGRFLASQCLGIAYANLQRWPSAAQAFEDAAHEAETARDDRAARYWAQAGNAWLAGNVPDKARAALDAALAAGTLSGLELGEAQFDRGRALVAAGQLGDARTAIDAAVRNAPADPLIWLASATLARRMGNLALARAHAAEAFQRSPDDPAVYLEIGNIAAASGDAAGARAAWNDAVRLRPDSDAARRARDALKQFEPLPGP